MLRQFLRVFKLLGLKRAIRMKRHHDQGLTHVRGYAATCCWWTLMNNGFLDRLVEEGSIDIERYAEDYLCDRDVLYAIIEYLDGIGLLIRQDAQVRMGKKGRVLFDEPRGLFELLWAYEPCFTALPELLATKKEYGKDINRRITYVGLGSGRLCEQLPYPIMRKMVLDRGCRSVLDLGCGDLAFLEGLCRQDPAIHCHGIDYDPEMVAYDQKKLAQTNYHGRLTVQQGDLFQLPELPDQVPPVDGLCATDTFHEYLDDPQRIIHCLQTLRQRFPSAVIVIGEFCRQDPHWLKRHPTASLEHHLFHELSGQQIGSAAEWRALFRRAGLTILEEQVYDMIGHGYFMLT